MSKKIGKRARAVEVKPSPIAIKQKVGDLVGIVVDGERLTAVVNEVVDGIVRVETAAGRIFRCEPNELRTPICSVEGCGAEATKLDGLCNECRASHVEPSDGEDEDEDFVPKARARKGHKVNYRGIDWTGETHFNIPELQGVRFYGWWRKSRDAGGETIYMIDIFAERNGKNYTLDSVGYNTDPRLNLNSLNADISARCQVWMHHNFSDNAENIDTMRKRAEHPSLFIKQIGTIDNLIRRLNEFRNVAISCGGSRHLEVQGDDGGAPILITINVTPQAVALNGKPPSLHLGAAIDAAVKTGGRGSQMRIDTSKLVADPENVTALMAQLAAAKAGGREDEQRKLRHVLRKLGVKGGLRGAKAAQSTK